MSELRINHKNVKSTGCVRLKKISDQIKKDGVRLPESLRYLTHVGIAECIVGLSHLAFRLEDGRVCRIAYTINIDRLSSKSDKKKPPNRGGPGLDSLHPSRDSGGGGGGTGGSLGSGRYTICPQRSARGGSASNVLSRNTRSLNFLREMQRQGVYLARPLAPTIQASQVPEELIDQCQAVLQGKSRQLIVRELQRTNLDVNMAVNNLLSRDDEADDGEEWEDEAEDLLSLLDQGESNLIFDPDSVLPEELFTSAPMRRRGADASDIEYSLVNERRKRRRLETAAYQSHIRNSLSDPMYRSGSGGNTGESGRHGDKGSNDSASGQESRGDLGEDINQPIQLGGKLEFWRERGQGPELRFQSLAGLYSELVGLSISGELHQWRWIDTEPYNPPVTISGPLTQEGPWAGEACRPPLPPHHPRAAALGLVGEEVRLLSGWCTRATVLTASGKLATWMDESLAPMAGKLEHTAQFLTLGGQESGAPERISALYTAPLVTVARCESGALYWWGVLPHYLRKKVVEKARQKSTSSYKSSGGSTSAAGTTATTSAAGNGGSSASQTPAQTGTPGSGNTAAATVVWRPVGGGSTQRTIQGTVAPVSNTATPGLGASVPSVSSSLPGTGPSPIGVGNWLASSTGNLVIPGAFVCMKNAPIFHAGAIGFTVVDGVPKVGTLLEDAWRLTDVCRFRVKSASVLASERRHNNTISDPLYPHHHNCAYAVQQLQQPPVATPTSSSTASSAATVAIQQAQSTSGTGSLMYGLLGSSLAGCEGGVAPLLAESARPEMPPPPSPASSTCSDQSGPVRVSPGSFKRKKHPGGGSRDREGSEGSSGGRTGGTGRCSSSERDRIDGGGNKRAGTPNSEGSHIVLAPVEEDWCLTEVIFVEDGRTQPVGCVLKVDGNIAAVKFLKDSERACLAAGCPMVPLSAIIGGAAGVLGNSDLSSGFPGGFGGSLGIPGSTGPTSAPDPISWLQDCRLLRKEELTVVKNAGSPRVPDFIQRTPKKIVSIVCTPPPSSNLNTTFASNTSFSGCMSTPTPSQPSSQQQPSATLDVGILAMAVENSQVHLIVRPSSTPTRLDYQVYSLQGKLINRHRFVSPAAAFLGKSSKNISLINAGERPFLLRDGNGTVYPFLPPIRPNQDSLPSPHWLDLPRIRAAGLSVTRVGQQRVLVGLIATEEQTLMQHVLRADDKKVKQVLENASRDDPIVAARIVRNILGERCDGQRNVLHVAVAMCTPQSNKEADWAMESVLTNSGSSTAPVGANSYRSSVEINQSRNVHDALFRRSTPHHPPIRGLHILLPGPDRTSTSGSYPPPPTSQQPPPSSAAVVIPSSTGLINPPSSSQSYALGGHQQPLPPSYASLMQGGPEDLSSTAGLLATTRTSMDFLNTGGSSNENYWHLPPVRVEEKERRMASFRIVKMLVENPILQPYLIQLLSNRNAEGHTPFMQSVANRIYVVANYLFDVIQELPAMPRADEGQSSSTPAASSTSQQQQRNSLMSMIFPPTSSLDDSPLQMLCYNDTCSFTWTGPDHIRQDIFECRTCGLMDSLCCCTECARVCHKGHDCRLKRTSPTAYCDCWEKCRCKSLVAGSQGPRYDLLLRLINNTDLATYPNRRGEHLLLFLVKTVDRQNREQKQYRPSRRRAHHLRSTTSSASITLGNVGGGGEGELEMPEHDLDPPKFCRRALEAVLGNWSALETMLMTGTEEHAAGGSSAGPGHPGSLRNWEQEQVYLHYQSGSTHVDQFVFCLLTKCSPDLVDALVRTLNWEIVKSGDRARKAAARFVRSVARVFTTLSLEMSPDSTKKKSRISMSQLQPLDVCRTVFSNLLPISLIELPQLAVALIAPVRLGAVRPTAPFSLSTQSPDIINGCEELFSADPLTSRLGGVFGLHGDEHGNSGGGEDDRPMSPGLGDTSLVGVGDDDAADDTLVGSLSGTEGVGRGSSGGVRGGSAGVGGSSLLASSPLTNRRGGGSTGGLLADEVAGNDDEDLHSVNEMDTDMEMEMDEVVEDDDSDNDGEMGGILRESDSDSDSVCSAVGNDLDSTGETGGGVSTVGGGVTGLVDANESDPGGRGGDNLSLGTNLSTAGSSTAAMDLDITAATTVSGSRVTGSTANPSTTAVGGSTATAAGGGGGGSSATQAARSALDRLTYSRDPYSDSDDDSSQRTDDEDLSNESNEMNTIEIEDFSRTNRFSSTGARYGSMSSGASFRPSFYSTAAASLTSSAANTASGTLGEGLTIGGQVTSSSSAAGAATGGVSSASNAAAPAWMTWALRTNRNATEGAPGAASGAGSNAGSGAESGGRQSGIASSVSVAGTVVQGLLQSGRRSAIAGLQLQPSAPNPATPENKECGIQATQIQLTRAFASVVRLIGDLFIQMRQQTAPPAPLATAADMSTTAAAATTTITSETRTSAALTSSRSSAAAAAPLLTAAEQMALCASTGRVFGPVWLWLCCVMDSVEGQLRFGSALNKLTESMYPGSTAGTSHHHTGRSAPSSHRRGQASSGTDLSSGPALSGGGAAGGTASAASSSSSGENNRHDLLNYMLSIMRSSSDEHSDSLPVIDLTSYKHIAYALDAFLYLVKSFESWTEGSATSSTAGVPAPPPVIVPEEDQYMWPDQEDIDDEQEDRCSLRPTIGSECGESVADEETVGTTPGSSSTLQGTISTIQWSKREDTFFRRSESTLSLAGVGLDPIETPLSEALCLARKPHLLHPGCRREDLFGTTKYFPEDVDMTRLRSQRNDRLPIHLGMMSHWGSSVDSPREGPSIQEGSTTPQQPRSFLDLVGHPGTLLSRWHVTLEMFGRLFAEDVGSEPRSVILELGGFPIKESRFRREMERIRNSTRRDLTLEVERERGALIVSTIRQLNMEYAKRHNLGSSSSGSTPPLSCHRVKVTFRDEPGEGSGVARSFFTAFAEAVLSGDKLPNLEGLQSQTYQRFPQMTRNRRSISDNLHSSTTAPSNVGSVTLTNRVGSTTTTSAGGASLLQSLSQRHSASGGAGGQLSSATTGGSGGSSWRRTSTLSVNAQPFYPSNQLPSIYAAHGLPDLTSAANTASTHSSGLPSIPGGTSGPGAGYWAQKRQMGDRLYHMVQRVSSSSSSESRTAKVTGMLMEFSTTDLIMLLSNEEVLRQRVEEARRIIEDHESRDASSSGVLSSMDAAAASSGVRLLDSILSSSELASTPPSSAAGAVHSLTHTASAPVPSATLETPLMDEATIRVMTSSTTTTNPAIATLEAENVPLFWQPGLTGFYSPRTVFLKDTAKETARNGAYRNVGRILGMCLLMNETCPLTLCRHVLKHLLGRPIHWHDLAFFDPAMYEGLRQLLACTVTAEDGGLSELADYQLTFVLERCVEEGGGVRRKTVHLLEDGDNIEVTPETVFEYVKRYAEYRLVEVVKEPLDQMRKGVFDVIPRHCLDGLTAEDLRLLLNGAGDIDVDVLTSYTTFHDESGSGSTGSDRVTKFKRWFWHTIRAMNHRQRQDLLYFWTSSPALPASEQGFQPMPTITIRPADDCHLPTANTCISRLYIPLYSSKQILKDKLLQAIQTKGFGFV